MRTTEAIDDDVLTVARALAARKRISLGSALSELARRGFRKPAKVSPGREAGPPRERGIDERGSHVERRHSGRRIPPPRVYLLNGSANRCAARMVLVVSTAGECWPYRMGVSARTGARAQAGHTGRIGPDRELAE